MAFKRPHARILEITTTSGNGPYTLAGAADGSYNTFASFMADGDTTHVSVIEPGGAFWTGIATFNTGPNRITLTTVEESKGTFGAGTKEITASALASSALLREDLSGAIVTTGSASAYAVSSLRVYDTLTRLHGNAVAFTPHVTNNAGATLNVDGLGAKQLRLSSVHELQSNTLIAGTPYTALYNHSDGVFYLHMLGGNPYGIPLAGGLDYWGLTTPSSAYAFPIGQALSRAVYALLFNIIGTTYGLGTGGDGTTFGLPDKSGRVSAMKESVATRLTAANFGIVSGQTGATLGAVGGDEKQALALGHLPTGITAANASQNISVTVTNPRNLVQAQNIGDGVTFAPVTSNAGFNAPQNAAGAGWSAVSSLSGTTANSIGVTSNNTGSQAAGGAKDVPTVPPMIVCNYIMRII